LSNDTQNGLGFQAYCHTHGDPIRVHCGLHTGDLVVAAGTLKWWVGWAYVAVTLAVLAVRVAVPTLLVIAATLVRTPLGDRTLQEELAGYKEYTRRVRYHLLPGVW
jgi:protein-S-isoprenylcysteine O-methyltransferase Ste14